MGLLFTVTDVCVVIFLKVYLKAYLALFRTLDLEKKKHKHGDHLTPKKQNLLFEAKKFKELNHYQFCWAKNSTIYLRKDESSRVIKISDTDTLRRLASDT